MSLEFLATSLRELGTHSNLKNNAGLIKAIINRAAVQYSQLASHLLQSNISNAMHSSVCALHILALQGCQEQITSLPETSDRTDPVSGPMVVFGTNLSFKQDLRIIGDVLEQIADVLSSLHMEKDLDIDAFNMAIHRLSGEDSVIILAANEIYLGTSSPSDPFRHAQVSNELLCVI